MSASAPNCKFKNFYTVATLFLRKSCDQFGDLMTGDGKLAFAITSFIFGILNLICANHYTFVKWREWLLIAFVK